MDLLQIISYKKARILRQLFTLLQRHRFASFGEGSLLHSSSQLLWMQYVHIGKRVSILDHCFIECHKTPEHTPRLTIGDDALISSFCHVSCANEITLKEGVQIGKFCMIVDNNHGHIIREELDTNALDRPTVSKGGITIGEHCWIGDHVMILPNVTIGKGSIVGAGSVVTHSIPPYSVAAGNPAHVIKSFAE